MVDLTTFREITPQLEQLESVFYELRDNPTPKNIGSATQFLLKDPRFQALHGVVPTALKTYQNMLLKDYVADALNQTRYDIAALLIHHDETHPIPHVHAPDTPAFFPKMCDITQSEYDLPSGPFGRH